MRKFLQSVLLGMVVMLATSYSCHAQQGPTQPSVSLSWTQSTSTGVTANCVYRGSASGSYTLPALFCSTAPITTYTDSTATASTTYWYAVTAKVGASESAYSVPLQVIVPANPNAPTGLTAPTVTKNEQKDSFDLQAKVEWRKP
jgi:hypothetical protein